jgi:transporter family-2 protein
MTRWTALALTLLVGGVVALQPPANALLARITGDVAAAFTSLLLSTTVVGLLLLATGNVGDLAGLAHVRPVHVIGAFAGAAIVLVSLIAVRQLGAGGVAAALVVSQLVVAAIIDRLGWLGLDGSPLSAAKLAGFALLIAGTALITAS